MRAAWCSRAPSMNCSPAGILTCKNSARRGRPDHMPSQEKKRWAQLRVGLLATGALIILAVLVFVLTSSHGFFKRRTEIYTYLDDSAAVAIGSPVRLNGIDIGRISA